MEIPADRAISQAGQASWDVLPGSRRVRGPCPGASQAGPAARPPDRLPDSYQIYSLLMPGQVFTDMDSGQNQPWAISDTTVNEDDMNPKLAPEATLQPPADNPRGFKEAVNDYNQRKKERLVLTRRFNCPAPTCC